MSGFAPSRDNAKRVVAVFVDAVASGGPRLLAYSELASALGLNPNQARNLGPLLDEVRRLCMELGVPDISAAVVAKGSDLPSPKSFNGLSGTWRHTGLDAAGVRREQERVLAFDWVRWIKEPTNMPLHNDLTD